MGAYSLIQREPFVYAGKNHLGTLKYWLPPAVVDISHAAQAWLRWTTTHRRILARNVSLHNRYFGHEVFILGNGPSLNNFDLRSIYGRRVITMNHFELHPQRDKFDIVAHCVGERYGTPTWEDPRPMLRGVPARLFCFDISAYSLLGISNEMEIHYYAAGIPVSMLNYRSIDLRYPSLSYQSTSQMAIALAIFMGFKRINLLGFDHDWLVTRGNSPHFYEEREEVDSANLSAFSYVEMIEISRTLFHGYVKLRTLAETLGCRIYNLSSPSYLDVFPTSEQTI